MAWLITNERVRDYGCDSVRAAAEYFSKACAPGAHSAQYQIRNQDDYWEYSHLCDLCHGTAGHYCERNHMEDYYGHTGAFRYLISILKFLNPIVFLLLFLKDSHSLSHSFSIIIFSFLSGVEQVTSHS